MLAEILFMCPTYWLSDAFSQAWKYEFALTPAYHSYDTGVIFFQNQSHPSFTSDFVMAFQREFFLMTSTMKWLTMEEYFPYRHVGELHCTWKP